MAAIGTTRAQALIAAARAAGITDEALEKLADRSLDWIESMSGREADALETAIASRHQAAKERTAATAEALRLAELGGYKVDVIAAKLKTMTLREIADLVAQTRAFLASKGIDVRQPVEPETLTATPRQVTHILDLLARRQASGEGGGFYSGPTSREEVAKMTRENASLYIRSLGGDY